MSPFVTFIDPDSKFKLYPSFSLPITSAITPEMMQRQQLSSRTLHLKTSSSSRRRSSSDRRPTKPGNQSAKEKKLRSSIADLESRVYQAQKELKNLKALLPADQAEEKVFGTEAARQENVVLRSQLTEAKVNLRSAETKQDESALKLSELSSKLESSRENVCNLNEKLVSVEKGKRVIEEEMKKLSLQSEQWQIAAEAAAQLLLNNGAGVEATGDLEQGRASMDESFVVMFETKDDWRETYRRGFGFTVFGDLWKMK